ncbi:hypothetical protein BVH03_04850 [Pseudomonas sp. PA15(2017)]|nr:hypothetical protein BVH03_04850 [Pseudomonas sp. PA15(2017)]
MNVEHAALPTKVLRHRPHHPAQCLIRGRCSSATKTPNKCALPVARASFGDTGGLAVAQAVLL